MRSASSFAVFALLVWFSAACAAPDEPAHGASGGHDEPAHGASGGHDEAGFLLCPATEDQGLRAELPPPVVRAASAQLGISRVLASGDTVFFLNGTRGRLQLLDVATPDAPRIRSELPMQGQGLLLDGASLVVIGAGGGIAIVDVSDLDSPRVASSLQLPPGGVEAVDHRGGILLIVGSKVHSYESRLGWVRSIELGAAPTVRGEVDFDAPSLGPIAAFTAAGAVVATQLGLLRIDVGADGNLVERGSLPFGGIAGLDLLGVEGGLVRVVRSTGASIIVSTVALDDADSLRAVGTVELPLGSALLRVRSLGPTVALVLDSPEDELVLVDLADPAAPVATTFDPPGRLREFEVVEARLVALAEEAGDLVLTAIEPGGGSIPLLALGVAPPGPDGQIEIVSMPSGLVGITSAQSVLAERVHLTVVELTADAAAPVAALDRVPGRFFVGSRSAMLALNDLELAVVDFSISGAPMMRGSRMLARRNQALAALDDSTGVLIDRTWDEVPRLGIGPFAALDLGPVDGELLLPLSHQAAGVFVHDTHAYVLSQDQGSSSTATLTAVDVSQRTHPRLGAALAIPATLNQYSGGPDVVQLGAILLIHSFKGGDTGPDGFPTSSDHRVFVVDLAGGDQPALLGELAPDGASWAPGLRIIDEQPWISEREPTEGGCQVVWRRRLDPLAPGGPRLGERRSLPGAILAGGGEEVYAYTASDGSSHWPTADGRFTVRAAGANGEIELESSPRGAVRTPWGAAVFAAGYSGELPGDMWTSRPDRVVAVASPDGVLVERGAVELPGSGAGELLGAGGGFAIVRSGQPDAAISLVDLRTEQLGLHSYPGVRPRAAVFSPGVAHVLDVGAIVAIPLPE